MIKDLIAVGQRGAAIIDENTPPNIKGFATDNVETCIAFFLIGKGREGNKKYALIHVDNQTTGSSINYFVRENFSEIDDHKLFINPMVQKEGVAREIFRGNDAKLNSLICLRGKKKNYYPVLSDGSLLIEIDRESGKADFKTTFETTNEFALIKARYTYDENFAEYRKSIHAINGIFGSEERGVDEFAIDVQFQGRHYTKLPQIDKPELSRKLEVLKNLDKNQITEWLSSRETQLKYPHFGRGVSLNHEAIPIIADEISSHFFYQKSCLLTEYKIPLLPDMPDQEKAIADLAFSIGEEADLVKHRNTDWSLCYTVNLRSSSLTKDVRELVGLDRLRINNPNEEQKEVLLDQIPESVIEDNNGSDNKVLITFSKTEENRKIISNIIKPDTAIQAAKQSTQLAGKKSALSSK
jgi:hypothetical protein